METLLEKCQQIVEKIYNQYDASHDFAHIERVLKNAEEILQKEGTANGEIVRLAVLLHDIDDAKYQREGQLTASDILRIIGSSDDFSQRVLACIDSVSFSGGNTKELTSIEGAIVRDADRLDAIGAIGIARTFAFGGARGRKLYDASETVREEMSEAEYRGKETASITHFYEKLLLLKELMVTEEGKRLAEQRHDYMVGFLKQLEWEVGLG